MLLKKSNLNFFGLLLCLAFILSACSQEKSLNQEVLGEEGPLFTETLLGSNDSFDLQRAVSEGRVLIVFWATWCPSCIEEIPILNEWQSLYVSDSFRIIGVNVQETGETVEQFLKENKITYPIILDEDGEIASQYGLSGLPAAILLEKGGQIIYYGFNLPDPKGYGFLKNGKEKV